MVVNIVIKRYYDDGDFDDKYYRVLTLYNYDPEEIIKFLDEKYEREDKTSFKYYGKDGMTYVIEVEDCPYEEGTLIVGREDYIPEIIEYIIRRDEYT